MFIGNFFNDFGKLLFLYIGTLILTCETIFFLFIFNVFFVDLSIKQAKPTSVDLDLLINFSHSKLDPPVVITSSIIRTFEFF